MFAGSPATAGLFSFTIADMSEPDLYTRIRMGDKTACDECIEIHTPMVYKLALRLLKDPSEAEDVTQETFLKAFRAIDTFEWRSELSTWLYRIAYNTALARLQGKKIEQVSVEEFALRTDSQAIPKQLFDWCCLPERDFDAAQTLARLEDAIEDLPETYKPVFVLRILEDLSTREVAETLGISEDNVKTRLRRARLWLQERLTN